MTNIETNTSDTDQGGLGLYAVLAFLSSFVAIGCYALRYILETTGSGGGVLIDGLKWGSFIGFLVAAIFFGINLLEERRLASSSE